MQWKVGQKPQRELQGKEQEMQKMRTRKECDCWKGKKAKQEKTDKRARKVGQVKEKLEEDSPTEEDSEDPKRSLSSGASMFHIREIKEGQSKRVKAIFELKDEGDTEWENI